jgi:hypothetical protein
MIKFIIGVLVMAVLIAIIFGCTYVLGSIYFKIWPGEYENDWTDKCSVGMGIIILSAFTLMIGVLTYDMGYEFINIIN